MFINKKVMVLNIKCSRINKLTYLSNKLIDPTLQKLIRFRIVRASYLSYKHIKNIIFAITISIARNRHFSWFFEIFAITIWRNISYPAQIKGLFIVYILYLPLFQLQSFLRPPEAKNVFLLTLDGRHFCLLYTSRCV